MNRFSNYQAIQDFKKSKTAIRDSVNYAFVVSPYLYDTTFFGFIKKIIYSLFFDFLLIKKNSDKPLLFYYSFENKKRKDYDYIPNYFINILGSKCSYLKTENHFSFWFFLLVLRKFPDSLKCAKGYRAGFLKKIACALLISKYRVIAEKNFLSVLDGVEKLVTFCDAQPAENLLTQMANSKNIKTFTNQHGQYRILDSRNISGDAEAYENFVSDHMFCWGKATQEEFMSIGLDSSRFITVGWIKEWCTVPQRPLALNVFGVMLNGESSKESNVILLEAAEYIAKHFSMKYIVRLHPWSNEKSYRHLLGERCLEIGHYELLEYLEKTDYSIAHMTGATIEMLHSNIPVYLLDEGTLANVFRKDGLFYTSVDDMVLAIDFDRKNPGKAKERINALSKWFNNDNNRESTIKNCLL